MGNYKPVMKDLSYTHDHEWIDNDLPLVDQNIMQKQPENDVWLALIGLAKPYDRKGLMQSDQYKLFTKRRF
jgi:glycine cleavage system H lipoate-binding protein